MTGKQFEQLVEALLIKYNIKYKFEGVISHRGHESSKGKYDLETDEYAIELKHINTLSNLTLPCCMIKGKVFIKSDPKVKTHQLKALRESNKISGLLIHEGDTNTSYWLNINDLDHLILTYGLFSTFGYGRLEGYEVDLEKFISEVK